MAPDYLVIARAHRAATTSVTRAEELSSNRATIMARTHPRVVIDAESVFLKVPLSAVEERRAEQEVQRTRAAFAGPWGHYAPENVELVEQGRLTVCRYARYDAVPTSLGEYERDVLTVLDALESGETGQMSSTDLYRRLQSPREPANFEDDDLENLRSRLLGQGTLPVLIGPSHGDLHRENVLRLRGGGIKLIDWPRGEDRNPRFLDAVYATLDLHRRRAGASLSEAAIAFMKNDIEGPLAERAGELLGSMSREDVILWRMLHAMSFYAHDARRDPGNQTLQTLRRLWG
ncbi:hypothetical protein ACFC3F_07845 [Microbacterium sp. NPDC055910]|uniref:hypothetical protein n=1 Tax=Microbacterium sp. NPDC055910 TaxID=3345659 RepID=UPI0035D90179